MEFEPEMIKKLLITFTEELTEQCQVMTDSLLALETDNSVPETINTIFRAAHNIKGAARGIGIKDIGDIAHHMETLFSRIQDNSLTVTSPLIDLCLTAVDNMQTALQAFKDKAPLPFDLDDFLAQLTPDAIKNNPSRKEAKPEIKTAPKTEAVIEQPIAKAESHSVAKPKSTTKESDSIRVTLNSLDRVSAIAEEIQVTKIAIDEYYEKLSVINDQFKRLKSTWRETSFIVSNFSTANDMQKLQQAYNATYDNYADMSSQLDQLSKNMNRQVNELTALSNGLLDEVRMLRLIPAFSLFESLPRIARDIAHELKKEVHLHITGDSVKMDKMVLEGIHDPIIHLIRNAIDHGIESPEIRLEKGKSAAGNIVINVTEQGSEILISISDDGAGIDTKQIAAKAIAKNILTESDLANTTENDLLELIFRPGFSTKDTITTLSGRGIGLDVVKANIDSLKGHVTVTTELGMGTTFLLRVPLTLASERGLLVTSGGQEFVLPTNLIERVAHINADEILDIAASQAIALDQHTISLRILSDILGLPRASFSKKDKLPIIVLKKGWHSIALFVEAIINEREIVVKPLEAPINKIPCVAGGTLAGTGQVIIVLNTNDLIDEALNIKQLAPIALAEHVEKSEVSRPHILVVDDSITTRTLEKNILENRNYQVTVAVNGKEAWDLLQEQPFSLVISDVSMPIMDGFSLTERVKQNPNLQNTPVILVTSLDSPEEKKRGIDVGANAYIVKSEFESDKLLQIVEQLI